MFYCVKRYQSIVSIKGIFITLGEIYLYLGRFRPKGFVQVKGLLWVHLTDKPDSRIMD